MNNLVSLNNNIFHHIVRCFNSQYLSRFTHTDTDTDTDTDTEL